MLPCNVSVRNSICNCYKPTVKYVCKSIGDSNVNSSKLIYASPSCPSKPMVVMFTWVDLLFLVLPVQVNLLVVVMFVQLTLLVLALFALVNRLVVLMFVQKNSLELLIFK